MADGAITLTNHCPWSPGTVPRQSTIHLWGTGETGRSGGSFGGKGVHSIHVARCLRTSDSQQRRAARGRVKDTYASIDSGGRTEMVFHLHLESRKRARILRVLGMVFPNGIAV